MKSIVMVALALCMSIVSYSQNVLHIEKGQITDLPKNARIAYFVREVSTKDYILVLYPENPLSKWACVEWNVYIGKGPALVKTELGAVFTDFTYEPVYRQDVTIHERAFGKTIEFSVP